MEKTEIFRPNLKWRLKLRKVHLLIPVFLILLMSILSLSFVPNPSISSSISLVHAQELSLEVYGDPDCTSPIRDIYWGVLYPGQSAMKTIYVRNSGTTEESLSLATDNWNPPVAETYLSLTWDYDGSKLKINEVRETTLTLSVLPNIKDVTDFSFDIHIATELAQPQPTTSEIITDLTINVSPSTVSVGEDLTVFGELRGEYAISYVLRGVIEGAPISLSTTWGLKQNTITKSDGSYIFQINAPTEGGDYTITVSLDGDGYFASCQATTTVTVTPLSVLPIFNLLSNPSVEDDKDMNGIPDYWSKYVTLDIQATCSWVSDAHTGQKGVRIDLTHNPSASQYRSALWCQEIPKFTIGKTYKLRVCYKSNMSPTILLLVWGGDELIKVGQLDLPASSTWRQSEWLSVILPSGTTRLRVDGRLYNRASGWVIFDDFELVEA